MTPPPLASPAGEDRDRSLAEESLLLGHALTSLRQRRDSAAALADLDQYQARFPSGVLNHEAQRARADALLMAGRFVEARTVLSGLQFGAGVRDVELRLIRAELVAENDCAGALGDFGVVRAEHPASSLGERALWGGAACHAKLGNDAAARTDFVEYLERFPAGPHAAAARERVKD